MTFARVFERWPFLRWVLAVAPALIFVVLAQAAQSRVVYGTRYFWLNDDQMISMCYARNLVQGHGLVYNPGERVEGYTNPLWTVILAGIHLLGIAESKISLVPKLLNGIFVALTALYTVRIAQRLEPRAARFSPFVVLSVVMSLDVLYWAIQGFETTLLGAVFVYGVDRALRDEEGAPSPLLALAIGVLPLVRSDAFHLAGALALLVLLRHGVTRRVVVIVGAAAVLPAAHLLWRHGYYGDWLPNTYYAKVVGLHDRIHRAAGYTAHFVARHAAPLVLTAVAFALRKDRVRGWMLVAVAACVVHVFATGGDVFGNARYFTPIIPLIVACSFAVLAELPERWHGAPWALAGCLWLGGGAHDPGGLASGNGFIDESTVAGVAIARNTRPEATVAVVAAGAVSYFGHRHSIDTLGKTNREIARLPARGTGPIGHLRYDYDLVLSRGPDVVVSLLPFAHLSADVCNWNREYPLALPCSREFQRAYADHRIEIGGMPNVHVFVREGTPEALVKSWGTP